jgi:hypothetical protein
LGWTRTAASSRTAASRAGSAPCGAAG